MTANVAIVAIAKDEAPYFHEWVHHHFYLGFDSIYIGINRTSDQSPDILKRISDKYPNLYYENLDWLDKGTIGPNPDLQFLAYAYLSNKVFSDTQADYVLYIDIDEFWFSKRFQGIEQFIANTRAFDIASFNWFCQCGEDVPFSAPFQSVKYTLHQNTKSMLSKQAFENVEKLRCHIPYFTKDVYSALTHVDSNGDTFESRLRPNGGNTEHCVTGACEDGQYYILHRMFRSQNEYLSTVFRGNPEGEAIKRNRSGFHVDGIELHVPVPNEYYLSLTAFIAECGLQEMIDVARNKRLSAHQASFESMNRVQLIREFPNALRALKSTALLDLYVKRLINRNSKIQILKELKVVAEKYSARIALQIEKRIEQLKQENEI